MYIESRGKTEGYIHRTGQDTKRPSRGVIKPLIVFRSAKGGPPKL